MTSDDTLGMSMTTPEEGPPRRGRLHALGAALIILGAFYLTFRLGIGPHLLYHQQCPAFETTVGFLRGFLGRPGGPGEYVSAFLMQWFYYPWAGAAVATAVAALICLAARGVLRGFAGRRVHPSLPFIPLVLLLMVQGHYAYRLSTSVALLAALACVNVYIRTAGRGAAARSAGFALLYVLLYYTAGGMAVLYGVLCGLFELLKKRSLAAGVVYVLTASVVPAGAAMYSFQLDAVSAYGTLLPDRGGNVLETAPLMSWPVALHVLLMLFFPAAAILAALPRQVTALRRKLASLPVVRRLGGAEAATAAEAPSAPRWSLLSLGTFLAAAALLVAATFSSDTKTRLRIDYYADHNQWEPVLRNARRLSPSLYGPITKHDVNLALYHTGRLPYEMFSYPQKGEFPTLAPDQNSFVGFRKVARFAFELGQVNLAQHRCHMALEVIGEHPPLLQMLARIAVLKKRTRLARTFLGALERHLLWKHWAEEYRRRLDDDDPDMTSDREIQDVRPVMIARDYGYGGFGGFRYDQILLQALETNRHNRMAFEYLMAHFLLTKKLGALVNGLRGLDDFDYVGIPRHWEEAVLVYRKTQPDARVNLGRRVVSAESVERFRGFYRDVLDYERSSGTSKKAAYRTLVERWGDSYFFYFTFGYSEPRPGWHFTLPDELEVPEEAR